MERLTEDYNDSYCLKKCYPNNDSFCDGDGRGCPIDNCGVVIEALNKLGEYEKAEEQGLLVRLPCPIGTTVYDICGMDIRENVLSGIECGKDGKQFLWANHDEQLGELNDLVFLTREDAEKKLEKLQNNA